MPLGNEPFEQYRNEHEMTDHRVETDSFFKIRGMCYHIECQATSDSSMAVRMIEYDFAIALEQAIRKGAPYEMRFPESSVLFLRNVPNQDRKLQMRVMLPNGESFMYETGVVLAQSYDRDEIFSKRLLVLLPFYIMRYESEFDSIANSDEKTVALISECESLRLGLEQIAVAQDKALLYEHLVELAVRVSDHMLAKQDALRQKVRASMGGEILELMSDRIAAAEEEARKIGLEQGLEKGLEQGLEQGLERGRAEGQTEMADRLRALGVSEEIIAQAIDPQ